ncbi:phage tail assembly protein [Pseudomonas caspiana]|uniref:phage tail assembly protein n=1 Tax=Pseudomonas caspiana TaxID=1451454 RepID=UPI0032F08472
MSQVTQNYSWLTFAAGHAQIKLSRPAEVNGVQVDTVTMREPTVRDVRAATATSNGDSEQREMMLFASLTEMGSKDLEGLPLKDYNRLQAGYFRMVQDDEL